MAQSRKKAPQEVAISDFKARCLSLLEEVNKTKIPLRITKRGKALVDVVPAIVERRKTSWLGSMAGTAEILGDIVSPIIDLDTIEAMRK